MEKTIEETSIKLEFLEQKKLNNLLYVGVDVHKDQHTALAVNCFSQILWEKEINNSKEEFCQLVKQIKKLAEGQGLEPVFGLEDTSGYGLRLACYLYQQNLPVKTISPVLVDRGRKYETHPEKSDSLDALGVAKALIQRIGTLPDYTISKTEEISKEIKELAMDREFLVKEQTRIKNQLHRLLHKAYNSGYREKFKNPFSVKALNYWSKYPVPKKSDGLISCFPILKNQIKRKLKRLRDIKKEVIEIEKELRILMDQTEQKIETLNGCGLVLASSLLAEIKNIDKFKSPDALAKYGGLCPREKSSGKKLRHIKTKSGNRKLNKAIHRIAFSQIGRNGNQYAKEYFLRKVSEGKSKSQALCCLKRRLVNIIFMMLKHKQEYRYSVKNLT